MRRLAYRILNLIYALLGGLRWVLFTSGAVAIGRLRPRMAVRSVWPAGNITLGPRLVLFMHFDRRGNVRPQTLHYLAELAASGRQIIFITNAGLLTPAALRALQPLCASIMIRKNQGYDFGAWRDAIEHFQLPARNTEELILANDSVFGPLRPLAAMLARIDYTKADFWGLTESWQYRYHLQSFFLAFGKTALHHKSFAAFWAKVRPVPSKVYIVKNYEVGITQFLLRGGLHCAAIWPYQSLITALNQLDINQLLTFKKNDSRKLDPVSVTRKTHLLRMRDAVAKRHPLNPTAELWRQLLQAEFPFIKRELLRDNPTRVEDIHDWVSVLRDDLNLNPQSTLDELRPMLKRQAL